MEASIALFQRVDKENAHIELIWLEVSACCNIKANSVSMLQYEKIRFLFNHSYFRTMPNTK